MRRLFALAIVLGALAPALAAAQSFEGVVTAKIHADAGREPMEMHYMLRQGVLRMEMGRGEAGSVVIADSAKKTSYLLMPSRRMYMAMPVTAGPAEQKSPEIVRTGRKEKIAGHECEHWLVKDPSGDLDACVATGLGTFSTAASMGRESAWSGALREQQGFPLKVARASGPTIMEVTKIESKRLDAALFTPPADYKKMEMPAGMPTAPRQR
jgi:hypothetical protein